MTGRINRCALAWENDIGPEWELLVTINPQFPTLNARYCTLSTEANYAKGNAGPRKSQGDVGVVFITRMIRAKTSPMRWAELNVNHIKNCLFGQSRTFATCLKELLSPSIRAEGTFVQSEKRFRIPVCFELGFVIFHFLSEGWKLCL